MEWNNDQVKQLETLWAQGMSASQIMAVMGGDVTRSAILGKVRRMNLPMRGLPTGKNRKRLRAENAFGLKKTKPTQKRDDVVPVPKSEKYVDPPSMVQGTPRKTFEDLDRLDGCCRWPIKHGYCGAEKLPGLSYCAPHCERAFSNWEKIQHRFVRTETTSRETREKENA